MKKLVSYLKTKFISNHSGYHIILSGIVILGVIIRCLQYYYNRSLWLDEAALALNLVNKPFSHLLGTFDNAQLAPIGFLVLTKILLLLFGNTEYILRIIPYVSSVLSIFLFLKLLNKCVPKISSLIALSFFCFMPLIVRYSTEFKPYCSDMCIAIWITLFGIHFSKKELTAKKAFYLGVAGFFALLFSFPSVFMLAAIGTTLLILYFSEGRKRESKYLFLSFIFWLGGFLIQQFFASQHASIETISGLQEYWSNSFVRLLPTSIQEAKHSLLILYDAFDYYLMPSNFYEFSILGVLAFFAGCISLAKKNKVIFAMMIMPILFAISASVLRRYPFTDRCILFYAPFCYLLVAQGIGSLCKNTLRPAKIVGFTYLIILLAWPLSQIPENLKPIGYEEIKIVLEQIQKEIEEDDTIYIYYGAELAFEYYKKFYGLDKFAHKKLSVSRCAFDSFRKPLAEFENEKRVWIVFSHVWCCNGKNEEGYIVRNLDSIGKRIYSTETIGASGYLYELK